MQLAFNALLQKIKNPLASPSHANLATPQAIWAKLQEQGLCSFYPSSKQWLWLEWVLEQSKPFAFMGARKIGKTELLTIFQVVYLTYHNPHHKTIIITGNQDRSAKMLSLITLMLQSLGVSIDRAKAEHFFTTANRSKTPTLQCRGLGSKLKGDHLDLIIIDDPLDESEAFSLVKKRKVMAIYQEALSMVAGKRLMLIGQYVASDDIFCTLKDKIAFKEAWYDDNAELCNVNLDELLADGVSHSYIAKNYLGQIISDDFLPFTHLATVADSLSPSHAVIGVLDVAFGGGDYNALTIIGQSQQDEQKLVALLFCFSGHWLDVVPSMATLLNQYGVDYFYFEGSTNRQLKEIFTGLGFKTLGLNNKGNKHLRIMRLYPYIKTGHLAISNHSMAEALKQARLYHGDGSANDDVLDSLEMAVRLYAKYS